MRSLRVVSAVPGGSAQIAQRRSVPQFPGYRCKRLELFAPEGRSRNTRSTGPAIDRCKINRFVQARENTAACARHSRV